MDLVEILKDAPEGTKLYSTAFGYVELLSSMDSSIFPIKVRTIPGNIYQSFTKEGKIGPQYQNTECLLFPSKENRDWSKFQVEKSYEFKPFDKVLVRNGVGNKWKCDYFSHMSDDNYYHVCVGNIWKCCIPYNNNTKHLIGTTENF